MSTEAPSATNMHWDHLATCPDCHREFDHQHEAGFFLEDDEFLCLACALRRGGLYDASHQIWLRPPDLAGLE